MKKIIFPILSTIFIIPFNLFANDTFSVEIMALKLVMEKYSQDLNDSENLNDEKPNYMAFKHDECNATVKITEKNGLQITTKESFDVNVCKKEIL